MPIAEKYSALARDAQASGDRVMAENLIFSTLNVQSHHHGCHGARSVPFQREETFDDDGADDEKQFHARRSATARQQRARSRSSSTPAGLSTVRKAASR